MQGLGPSITPRESPLLRLDGDTDYDDEDNNRPPTPLEAPVAAPRLINASSPSHATLLLLSETQPIITDSVSVSSKFKMIDLQHRDSDVTVATTFSTQVQLQPVNQSHLKPPTIAICFFDA
jgi:hypothetical protein